GTVQGGVHIYSAKEDGPRQNALVCSVSGDRTWAEWLRALLNQIGYLAERQNWRFTAGTDLAGYKADLLARDDRVAVIVSQVSANSPFYTEWVGQLLPADRTLVVRIDDVPSP